MTTNKYLFGDKSTNDIARLIHQGYLLNKLLGLLPPEGEVSPHYQYILDLGTGPGTWCIEMASQFPDREIIGVDINPDMIQYAQTVAQLGKLQNIRFDVVDVTNYPLPFKDNQFGIVSSRYIGSFVERDTWPLLLKECLRILQPGGLLILNEHEIQITNSLTIGEQAPLYGRMLYDFKKSFSLVSFGYGFAFHDLLNEAGFTNIVVKPNLINFSSNQDIHQDFIKDSKMGLYGLKNIMRSRTGHSDEELDILYQKICDDLDSPDFRAVSYGVWGMGHKPTTEKSF